MRRFFLQAPFPAGAARSRLALTALLAAATGAVVCAQPQAPPRPESTRPTPRDGAWRDLHEKYLKRAARGDIDLLFLGDSITQGWDSLDADGHGPRQVWDRYYGPRKAANFGIGGDSTQHILWRLDHGEVDGLSPRVVVLLIGTNNLGSDTPAEIAGGVTAVVEGLREKLPKARVLLLGVFPRGKTPNAKRERIKAVNARIARLDDGAAVRHLDIGHAFLDEHGEVAPEIMPDYLHLSRRGYRLWADAMEPTLRDMLQER